MRWLRTNNGWRVLVAFLTASLLPMLMAPLPRAGSHAVAEDYGDWLRSQLRAPADDVFDDALASAHEKGPESFTEFLQAFAAAYDAQDPEEPLSEVLDTPGMSTEGIVACLQKRLVTARGIPLVHPLQLAKQVVSDDASDASFGVFRTTDTISHVLEFRERIATPGDAIMLPVRILFSAQPRGP